MFTEKIANFLSKLFFLPILFIMLYACILNIGIKIISNYYNQNNILFFIIFIIVSSLISFIFTYIISLIFFKFKKYEKFEAWFEWIHFAIIYTSGLISLLVIFQSTLLKYKIIRAPINTSGNYLGISLIFFIAISNYYFYKNISSKQGPKLIRFIKTIWYYLKYYIRKL